MIFTASKSDLVAALSQLAPIAGRSVHMPILECVHLSCETDNLILEANNLETAVRLTLNAMVQSPGSVCAPAKRLVDVCKACADDTIAFDLDADTMRLSVKSGSARFAISCLDASDFPAMPAHEGDPTVLPFGFADALESVVFCASTDETRFGLSSVCIEPVGPRIQFTTTDGHRLARAQFDAELTFPEKGKALLPRTAAAHLCKQQKTCSSLTTQRRRRSGY